jgi:hypothetical protein
MNKIVSRKFTLQDQLDFAALSGDYNPAHIDSLYARRTIFGRAVVHGVHLLMGGLESFLSVEKLDSINITNIRADFWKSIGLNEEVVYSWEYMPSGKIVLQINSDDILHVKCSFTLIPNNKCCNNTVERERERENLKIVLISSQLILLERKELCN